MASDPDPGPQSDPQTPTITDPLTNEFATLNDLTHDLDSLNELASRGSWRTILDKVARARALSFQFPPQAARAPHVPRFPRHRPLQTTPCRRRLRRARHPRRPRRRSLPLPNLPEYLPDPIRIHGPLLAPMAPRSPPYQARQAPTRPRPILRPPRFLSLETRTQGWHFRKYLEKAGGFCNQLHHRPPLDEQGILSVFEFDSLFAQLRSFQPCLDLEARLHPNANRRFGSAKSSFNRVESMVETESGVELKNLVNRNKAMVYMVGKDYVSAVREYEECIERDPMDVVAINNKAICLMYLRDLLDSIKVLESALERVPTVALNETLVVNLCSMNELAYVNHSDIKRTLSNWIARVAPDDFDSSCTRI